MLDNYLPVSVADQTALYGLRGRVITDAAAPFALWPAILEKALATMWGSYTALEETTAHPVTEDIVFRTLGINSGLGDKLNLLNASVEVTAEKVQNFVTRKWTAGCAITAPGSLIQHNYAVAGVSETGVVMSDPRTGWSPDERAHWERPATIGGVVAREFLNEPGGWPIFSTWAQTLDYFRWFYAYNVPVADDSKPR